MNKIFYFLANLCVIFDINSMPNVLSIGMMNRRELLDDVLLRLGRLKVQKLYSFA